MDRVGGDAHLERPAPLPLHEVGENRGVRRSYRASYMIPLRIAFKSYICLGYFTSRVRCLCIIGIDAK